MVGTTLGVLGLGNDNLKRLTGFHMVMVIYTNTSNRGPKKDGKHEDIIFFYGKLASFGWDPDRWRWLDRGRFLNYTTKDGREFITNSNLGSTRGGNT